MRFVLIQRAAVACLLVSLFIGCVILPQGKNVREATERDFQGTWTGYGASGNYFFRLALTNGIAGTAVIINQYDESIHLYHVEQRHIDFKKWSFIAYLNPIDNRERINLAGSMKAGHIELQASGIGWEYRASLWNENALLLNIRRASREKLPQSK